MKLIRFVISALALIIFRCNAWAEPPRFLLEAFGPHNMPVISSNELSWQLSGTIHGFPTEVSFGFYPDNHFGQVNLVSINDVGVEAFLSGNKLPPGLIKMQYRYPMEYIADIDNPLFKDYVVKAIIHEFRHLWQFSNTPTGRIRARFNMLADLFWEGRFARYYSPSNPLPIGFQYKDLIERMPASDLVFVENLLGSRASLRSGAALLINEIDAYAESDTHGNEHLFCVIRDALSQGKNVDRYLGRAQEELATYGGNYNGIIDDETREAAARMLGAGRSRGRDSLPQVILPRDAGSTRVWISGGLGGAWQGGGRSLALASVFGDADQIVDHVASNKGFYGPLFSYYLSRFKQATSVVGSRLAGPSAMVGSHAAIYHSLYGGMSAESVLETRYGGTLGDIKSGKVSFGGMFGGLPYHDDLTTKEIGWGYGGF